MTLRKFNKLYNHYKDNFDFELYLKTKGITYAQNSKMAMQEEEWL